MALGVACEELTSCLRVSFFSQIGILRNICVRK